MASLPPSLPAHPLPPPSLLLAALCWLCLQKHVEALSSRYSGHKIIVSMDRLDPCKVGREGGPPP